MKVIAKLKNLRISPRKARLATSAIKGLDVSDAQSQMENTIKKSSPHAIKLLSSAIANAENNFGLDKNNLYIYDARIEEGAKLKRWMPRAYGRATQILKRSSDLIITLEERVEGKNRKTKEQLAKERKEKETARKKEEEEIRKQRKEEDKKEEKVLPQQKNKIAGKEEKKGAEKGWMKKVFNRKAG